MQKLFFTLILGTLSFSLFGQNLEINMDSVNLKIGEYLDYNEAILTNTGTGNMEIAVNMERLCYDDNDDTQLSLCFGELCFAATDNSMIYGAQGEILVELTPSEMTSGQIKITPSLYTTYGSEWSFSFFDRNNPQDRVTMKVTFEACGFVSSTTNLYDKLEAAFPNPSSTQITIPLPDQHKQSRLHVLNATGQLLETLNLNDNDPQVLLDISEYHEGVYFYYIMDKNAKHSPLATFLKQG